MQQLSGKNLLDGMNKEGEDGKEAPPKTEMQNLFAGLMGKFSSSAKLNKDLGEAPKMERGISEVITLDKKLSSEREEPASATGNPFGKLLPLGGGMELARRLTIGI